MQTRPSYPTDTATGACFITGRYEVPDGEVVIDLDLDVETLPAWGRLCLSQLAVELLMQQLGWERPTENLVDANTRLRDENKVLRVKARQLQNALQNVLDAAQLAGLEALAADETVDLIEMSPVGADA